jgi:hypothetical protein
MLNVFLFYAAIILIGGLTIALFVAAVATPVVLMFLRFGPARGVAFLLATGAALLIGGRMSYGHILTMPGADPAMQYLMIWAQVLNTVPVALITAGLTMSAIGFTILLFSFFARRT